MIKVQRIVVPDTRQRSWVLFNAEQQPLVAPNQYLSYLHCLGRSPNTVRAYAHHLQAFLKFLSEEGRDWKTLTLAQLAEFVGWLRRTHSRTRESRADSTINTVLAAVGSFYEYQDRLGIETNISRSRRFGARSSYKPFLHHINRNRSLRRALAQVRVTRHFPRVFSPREVQALLRHADIRSFDGEIDIVPRANSNGARAKSRSPYTVHVSKELMALYADYLVHEHKETSHDYVFVNWWSGRIGAPMTYSTVIDLFRKLSSKTGLRATPHMFRHTHATELLRAGWDAAYVQRRLGHAQIQTTVNTYGHLSTGDMGEMFARYQRERAR